MNRQRAGRLAVNRGRQAEQQIARRLTRWADGLYTFKRRGLGHASRADLIVEGGAPAWPFVISVKSARGPSLAALLQQCDAGGVFGWWRELEGRDEELSQPELVARNRARAWLIWRSGSSPRWLISCWSLGGHHVPVRMVLMPAPAGWPRFTMLLDNLLERVTIRHAIAAIASGWGEP